MEELLNQIMQAGDGRVMITVRADDLRKFAEYVAESVGRRYAETIVAEIKEVMGDKMKYCTTQEVKEILGIKIIGHVAIVGKERVSCPLQSWNTKYLFAGRGVGAEERAGKMVSRPIAANFAN